MPIYEYRCQSCGYDMEALQKLSDGPLRDCPECQEPELVKLVSAAGFRLKGTGWYATDFKNGSKRKGEDKTKSDDKAKSDSKQKGSSSHSCGSGACGCG